LVKVLSQLWHRIQVGGQRVIGQSAKPIVAQDSGREGRGRLVRVLSQLWHRIQVGRTEGDWSECLANCGTGYR
jgi:hypothetical protein